MGYVQTQSTLVALRTEYENYKSESVRALEALQARVDQLEQENAEKAGQLDEERRYTSWALKISSALFILM